MKFHKNIKRIKYAPRCASSFVQTSYLVLMKSPEKLLNYFLPDAITKFFEKRAIRLLTYSQVTRSNDQSQVF